MNRLKNKSSNNQRYLKEISVALTGIRNCVYLVIGVKCVIIIGACYRLFMAILEASS